MEASEHARAYFETVGEIAAAIDIGQVDAMALGMAAAGASELPFDFEFVGAYSTEYT